jgi:hypothetical protein
MRTLACLMALPCFAFAQEPEPDPAEPVLPAPPPKPMAMPGGDRAPGYTFELFPQRPVRGTDRELGFVRQSLNVGAPVYKDEKHFVLLTASVRHTRFDTDAVLPDSRRDFPDTLWAANFGILTTRQFDNGWTGGLMLNFGSQSDRPFERSRDLNFGGAGFVKVPAKNGRDHWQFSVFYSPVGNLNFPVPGIAYDWNPSERLHIMAGIPFAFRWTPIDEVTLEANYVPLTNGRVKLSVRPVEKVTLYAAYESLAEAYFLHDRVENRDRFFVLEQRVVGGATWKFHEHGTLDFFAGYGFDRRYGEGRNQGGTLRDRVDLRPGAFLGARATLNF